MKYLKLYEDIIIDGKIVREKQTFEECLEKKYPDKSLRIEITDVWCVDDKLTDLYGIEKLPNLLRFFGGYNYLVNLNGIEKSKKLTNILFQNNPLTDISSIRNLEKLEVLDFSTTLLTSMEFNDFSVDALELGIDITDLNRFKFLKTLSCHDNNFSERYKKYIRNYCKEKNIALTI